MRLFLSLLAVSILLVHPSYAQSPEEEGAADAQEQEAAPAETPAVPAPKKQPEKPAKKPTPKPKPQPQAEAPKAAEPAVAEPLPSTSKPDTDYVMLRVGNQDIPASEVRRMWTSIFPPGAAPDLESVKPELRNKLLQGVMTERLLYAEAIKQGVEKSEPVQRDLEDIKRKLYVKALLEAKTSDISDKDLQSEYEKLVATLRDVKEARARHILVAEEKDATLLKQKIDEGKAFEDVAKEYSKDPGSAKQGGDLGYFTKDKMVKEFADAAFALKKGAVSAPVKTSFGWHLIKLEDVRPVTIPTFNDARDGLKTKIQERRLEDYVRSLVKQTDVKLFDAKGKELPFTKELPAN